MENDNLKFGIRIEHIMIDKGIKTSQLCEAVGINNQQYYDWKKKGTIPNAMTAFKVAKFLGTTVEYLLTGNNENPLSEKVDELQKRLVKINGIVSRLLKKAAN